MAYLPGFAVSALDFVVAARLSFEVLWLGWFGLLRWWCWDGLGF